MFSAAKRVEDRAGAGKDSQGHKSVRSASIKVAFYQQADGKYRFQSRKIRANLRSSTPG